MLPFIIVDLAKCFAIFNLARFANRCFPRALINTKAFERLESVIVSVK
jgi:hypothetical protein